MIVAHIYELATKNSECENTLRRCSHNFVHFHIIELEIPISP